MFDITKDFEFCYGHRVWSQKLATGFSDDGLCKCRHLHGHNATLKVTAVADKLDMQGMVTDFKNLDFVKKFIDQHIDHKFLMDSADPLMTHFLSQSPYGLLYNEKYEFWTVSEMNKTVKTLTAHEQELYESFVVVSFVPTSENIAKWLYGIIATKLHEINVTLKSVTIYETPKSCSTYSK